MAADQGDVNEEQMARNLAVENAAGTAVFALTNGSENLRRAAATFLRANYSDVVMTQGWADALRDNPHLALELTRMFAEPPADAGTGAAADRGPTPVTSSQQSTPCSSSRGEASAATTPPPAGPGSLASPGEDTIDLTSLSTTEINERLIQAAAKGSVDEVRALLVAGAELGAVDRSPADKQKDERLRQAAAMGSETEVRALLEAGADVDARDWFDRTAAHEAADGGHVGVLRLLAVANADLNCKDVFGQTPLHVAISNGRIEAVCALQQLGVDTGARNCRGMTPLHLAVLRGHRKIVETLVGMIM